MASETFQNAAAIFRFGPPQDEEGAEFEVDMERLEVRQHGEVIELRPQAIQALVVLVKHEGRLVTNEEFCLELWGYQPLGWRNSLHQCIRDLRRTLGDSASNPRFVATVTRRGYRFVGRPLPAAQPTHATRLPVRWNRLSREFRRPSVAFLAGFVAAVLLPMLLFAFCVLLAT